MSTMRHAPVTTNAAPRDIVPDVKPEMDQCGFCGGWYEVSASRSYGVCYLHDGRGSSGGSYDAPLDFGEW